MKTSLFRYVAAASAAFASVLISCEESDAPSKFGTSVGSFPSGASILGWRGNGEIMVDGNGAVSVINVANRAQSSRSTSGMKTQAITDNFIYYTSSSAPDGCCAELFRMQHVGDGSEAKLLDSVASPILVSETDSHVAYLSNDVNRLHIANIIDTTSFVVPLVAGAQHRPLMFSPDNNRVLYKVTVEPGERQQTDRSEYYIVHVLNGEKIRIYPEFSSDEQLIDFYWDVAGLKAMYVDTTDTGLQVNIQNFLAGTNNSNVGDFAGASQLHWMPKLNKFSYAKSAGAAKEFWVYDIKSGTSEMVLSTDANTAESPFFISPNGKRAAYLYGNGSAVEVRIVNLD